VTLVTLGAAATPVRARHHPSPETGDTSTVDRSAIGPYRHPSGLGITPLEQYGWRDGAIAEHRPGSPPHTPPTPLPHPTTPKTRGSNGDSPRSLPHNQAPPQNGKPPPSADHEEAGPEGREIGRVAVRALPDTAVFGWPLSRYLARAERSTQLHITVALDGDGLTADPSR
jgi:hypothetical protein